jgi:hypothetical protein
MPPPSRQLGDGGGERLETGKSFDERDFSEYSFREVRSKVYDCINNEIERKYLDRNHINDILCERKSLVKMNVRIGRFQ